MSAAEPLPVDPFCSAADPARYVPRAATEQALAELRAALADGPGAIAFTGPAGIGKSLLLRVLAAAAAQDYTFVCLQATPPGADQVCESALHALGDGATSDPFGMLGLRAALLARRGRPLVLLLESVEALPAQALADLAELPSGALRIVLVASDRDDVERSLEAFGPQLRQVRLSAPLSRAETEEYLQARLDAADASPELRVRLLGMALDLWRRSRGNPQCLHAEISQVQLELWRADQAEPRLRLIERSEPAETASELGDLEVGAELEAVPEGDSAAETAEVPPQVAPLEVVPLEVVPRVAGQGPGRRSGFALGALSGALATGAAVIALQWLREPAPLPEPARAAPVLPPVAAAPPAPLPAPATSEPGPPPPPVAVENPPPVPPAAGREPETAPAPAAPARAADPVSVQVQALPWATIYVDGELAGETPLGDLPVRPGLREFRAEMPDGRTLVKRVQVRAGTRVLFQ